MPRPTAFPRSLEEFFLLAKEADGCSPRTIEWLSGSLRDLRRFCAAHGFPTDLSQLRQEHILAWLVNLRSRRGQRGQPLKQNTLNDHWRAIRLFYNWAYETGKIDQNPCAGIKGPKPQKTLISVFKEHHIRAMLYLCPPTIWWGARDRAMVLTLLLTGVRLQELAGLTLSSINFRERYIRVLGKGNKERKIYLDRRLAKALLDWLMFRPKTDTDALWVSQDGKPLGTESIRSIIKRLGQRARITDVRVSPHTFRHTFAINMLREGKDVRFLQAILGHSTLKSTEIYVRTLDQEDALEWHKQVEPFKGWHIAW